MKDHLSHEKYVEHNFNKYLKKSDYRNNVLHSSIIEAITILASEKIEPLKTKKKSDGKYRTFSYAIDVLHGIYDKDENAKENINSLEKFWEERNEIIHGIMKDKECDSDKINYKIMPKLREKIIEVYKSDFFNKIFKEEGYKFSPKDKIK